MGSLQSELQRIAAEAEPNRGKRRKVEADNAQRDAMDAVFDNDVAGEREILAKARKP
jgi:hypothetical protein